MVKYKKTARHICLTGFMGTGKSTIGKILADHLQLPFVDTDKQVENSVGLSVKEIFAVKGEAFFREREAEQIERELMDIRPKVISLGGGALVQKSTSDLVMQKAVLIYIYSRPEKIYERIKHSTRRPLFRGEHEELNEAQALERIRELMVERTAGYNNADIVYDRDELDAKDVALNICTIIRHDYPDLNHTDELKSTR